MNNKRGMLKLSYFLVAVLTVFIITGHASSENIEPPVAPGNLKVSSSNSNSLRLLWDAVSDAEGYVVHRSNEKSGPYAPIAWTTNLSFTNTGLESNQLYYYQVQSYRTHDGKKLYGQSGVPIFGYTIGQPANLLTSPSSTSIRLNWSSVHGAEGYVVYRSDSRSGPYSAIAWVSRQSYTDSSLANGHPFYYKVRAYASVQSSKYYGNFSTSVASYTIGRPAIREVLPKSSTSIQITWSEARGAEGYVVYRSVLEGGPYEAVAWTKNNSLTDSRLPQQGIYYYKVQGYATLDNAKYYGAFSASASGFPFSRPIIKEAITFGRNAIRLTWDSVKGAEGYIIYQRGHEPGPYTEIASVNKNTFLSSGLDIGSLYHYKVRAFFRSASGYYFSDFSPVKSSVVLNQPEFVQVQASSATGVKLSWNPVDSATGYMVYRRSDVPGPYEAIASVRGTTFNNINLTPGAVYHYRVKAYVTIGSVNHYGDYSKTKTIVPIDRPAIQAATPVNGTTIKLTWYPVEGADGFVVYRKTPYDSNYEIIAWVNRNNYSDNNLSQGQLYQYKVRAFTDRGGTKYYGDFSLEKSAAALSTVRIHQRPVGSADSITLTWDWSEAAHGYILYRKGPGSDPYAIISTVHSESYTDNNLIYGQVFHYRVRPFIEHEGKKYLGGFSATASGIALGHPTINEISATSASSIKLTWTPVSKASGYVVYCNDGYRDEFSPVAWVKGSSFTHTGLINGQRYSYKIAAYYSAGSTKLYGDFGPQDSCYTIGKPVINSIAATDESSIKLDWSGISNADGYVVYRRGVEPGAFKEIARVFDPSYTDTGLVPGSLYHYRVKAYAKYTYYNEDYSAFSATKSCAALANPRITSATASNASTIKLTWSPVRGASGYVVYQKNPFSTAYKAIAFVAKNSFSNSGLTAGSLYHYRVRAYVTLGTTKHYGGFSTTKSALAIARPAIIGIAPASKTSIRLSWSPVYSASGYIIFRRSGEDEQFTEIAWVKGNTYIDRELQYGTLYHYKLKAYSDIDSNKYYGDLGTVKSCFLIDRPSFIDIIPKSADSMSLSWTPVERASGYLLYRKVPADSSYQLISWVKGTSFTDKNLTEGAIYHYKVRAYAELASGKQYGEFSAIKSGIVICRPEISNIVAENGTSTRLSWLAVSGVDGYTVYRSTTTVGPFQAIASLAGRAYRDQGLSVNDYVYYQIRAYKVHNGVRYYSDVSRTVKIALPFYIREVRLDDGQKLTIGNPISFSIDTNGGYGEKKYKATVYRNNVKYASSEYGTNPSFTFTPSIGGTYKITSYVLDGSGKKSTKDSSDIIVKSSNYDYFLTEKNAYFHVTNNTRVNLTAIDPTYSAFSLLSSDGETVATFSHDSPLSIVLPADTYRVKSWLGDYSSFKVQLKATVQPGLNRKALEVGRWGSDQIKYLGDDYPVTWSSSNTRVATINQDGKVKGIGKGTCTIYCTTSKGVVYKCTVKVIDCLTVYDVRVRDVDIYNNCYVYVRNNSDKVIVYYEIVIDQYDGRGAKLRSPYSYYYSSDRIEPYQIDSGKYWVNDLALSCRARVIYVKFSDGTVWKP